MTELSNQMICLVAFEGDHTFSMAEVAQAIKTTFPKIADKVGDGHTAPGGKGGGTLEFGDKALLIAQMPFPIPAETLAPAIGNDLLWRDEAEKAFAKTNQHLIVSVLQGGQTVADIADAAQYLTVAVAAIAGMSDALGIYWSASDTVWKPETFVEQAMDLSGTPPVDLWLGYRYSAGIHHPFRQNDSNTALACYTLGLAAFCGRELHCGPVEMEPARLTGLVRGIAEYVILTGKSIADGAQLGGDTERIGTVHYADLPLASEPLPIFNLELME